MFKIRIIKRNIHKLDTNIRPLRKKTHKNREIKGKRSRPRLWTSSLLLSFNFFQILRNRLPNPSHPKYHIIWKFRLLFVWHLEVRNAHSRSLQFQQFIKSFYLWRVFLPFSLIIGVGKWLSSIKRCSSDPIYGWYEE